MTTAPEIERYLLAQDRWVSSADLCARFDIDERELRCIGHEPGLISAYAISHTRKGYRHVRNATTIEWLAFKFAILRHAISEIRRVRRLAKVRHNVLNPTIPLSEADNGQGILL
jgi:hypothetical protein